MQIQAKLVVFLCDHGEELGIHYLDLELGNEYWNRVLVPISGYKLQCQIKQRGDSLNYRVRRCITSEMVYNGCG